MRANVSSRLIHKRNDRVRQMIRKLRNIVPLPGNIGTFRKDPLCIMHVARAFEKDRLHEGKEEILIRGRNYNESTSRERMEI